MKTRIVPPKPGFALVVTVSLMVLLSLVAIGMLSLSSIALRSSSQTDAISTARANARLSLMLAIGELQRHAGRDTRVTARADILDENNPPVLGVWRSWEGLDHETSGNFIGRPKAPGYDYRTMKDNGYTSGSPGQGRFLSWLTSANSQAAVGASASSSLPTTTPAAGAVALLGPGTIGTAAERENLQIHLTPTLVSSGQQSGATAWWVGGENQKAYIPKPEADARRGVLANKQAMLQAKSHSIVDPKPFGLDSVLADPERGEVEAEVNKALTLSLVDFLEPSQSDGIPDSRRSREFFHDLSTSAVGLLTNTATGGWRKDLSLLSEKWSDNSIPKDQLPFFRLTPEPANPQSEDTAGSFAEETNRYKSGSLFYPWVSYTDYGFDGIEQHPVASWNNLMDFASFYKASPDNINVRNLSAWSYRSGMGGDPDLYRHHHKVRVYPVIARIQWVFSHFSERAAPNPAVPGSFLFNPKLLVTPVITLWNPYNAKITMPNTNLYFDFKLMPVALSYQMNAAQNTRYNCIIHVDGMTPPLSPNDEALIRYPGSGAIRIQCSIPCSGTAFEPGKTKVYSPAADNRMAVGNSQNQIPLMEGFRFTGGHLYPIKHGTTVISAVPAVTPMRVRARFDTEYGRWYNVQWGGLLQARGVGVYTQVGTHPDPHNQQVQLLRSAYSPVLADLLYPKVLEGDLNAPTVSEVELVPKPFLSTIFGPRFTTKTADSVIKQHDIKGLAQSTPFGSWKNTHYRDEVYAYAGTGHPHINRFAYSFVAYSSGGSSEYPGSEEDGTGYIVTGEQSDQGLPRAVVAELPSRPLASLAELTHWDLRFENPAPPFAYNIIGNSDASPLLPANAVYNPAEASKTDNFRHDDFYCANHLLFDDWFFSSITPDPATFGGQARTQQIVYGEFIEGKTPLANRAYKPILEDQAFAANNPSAELYDDYIKPNDSWKTIASRLEVEGMFNVNSTSVAAWRALLGHARNQRVLYMRNTGVVADGGVKQHPASRFSISGEVEAGSPVAGAFVEASEVTGFRTLDDDFLDQLAVEVVKQVRLRGPFLSLAEFINRQLTNDETLALAGALQTALNELTKSGAALNPLASLQGVSTEADINPPQGANAEDQVGYVFPAAAEGYSTYGVPGWTRQADILRPLAPILSARDDTFVIRGYGDARDGSGKVIANAVCEAVVRRTREFVDPADVADATTSLTLSAANKVFGRRFEIVSFRWLAPEEV